MMKRTAVVYGVCIMLLMSMILRLCWVGLGGGSLQAMSGQSRYTLQVGSTRGGIYDCNMQPLVNREYREVSAVVPSAQTLAVLSAVGEEEKKTLRTLMENGKPFLYQGELQQTEGITTYRLPIRYTDSTACHIIGYLDGMGQGISGIEAAFESLLRQQGENYSVSCSVDAVGHAIDGQMWAAPQSDSLGGVVLSIDRSFQQLAEQALADGDVEAGAAVVMDIWSGEIKAMASLPIYDPNNVALALQKDDGGLLNRALCAYNVGSAFKLAVAAAALEEGVSPETCFSCTGSIVVDGTRFHCHNLAGHGNIDMNEAMNHSCNIYFIELARSLGAEPIRKMAVRLGFGSAIPLADGIAAVSGSLASSEELQGGELANFSFGQGRLTATPLQLAVMTAAIANGGEKLSPQLVLGTTEDGLTLAEKYPRYASAEVMSVQTSETLRAMMVQVVEEGSGANAAPAVGGAGGKTASAQTGRADPSGKELVHAWFVGFYPARTPRWAVVVLCEGGGSGGDVAAPVFRQICSSIADLGYVASDLNIP
ncbi:MAG: penicillin-binding protein 2 [Oscillospiraceae bacterium]|nr:penicillin-binding protein 2 [Oscillospiraceae bacterium]